MDSLCLRTLCDGFPYYLPFQYQLSIIVHHQHRWLAVLLVGSLCDPCQKVALGLFYDGTLAVVPALWAS